MPCLSKPRSLLAAATLFIAGADAFEFRSRYACGVCQELRSGQPCDRYQACDAGKAEEAAEGCSAVCPSAAAGLASSASAAPAITGLELRVSKATGNKEYNLVRISAITTAADPPEPGMFDYSAQFAHRWNQFYLHSALKAVKPGADNHFSIGGQTVNVRLPEQGSGVSGLLIADPCVNSPTGKMWIICSFGHKFTTVNNTPRLINTFARGTDLDFWSISGDNFYDRTGDITQDVFSRISLEAKSKIFNSVPGNHDYWVLGDPLVGSGADQCGNGFMQWYGQDTMAAKNASVGDRAAPFDFSVDPGKALWGCTKPVQANFLWYNQVGNLGMVGQTGAYSLDETRPFMQEACSWAASQPNLEVLVLFGHWDAPGLGASAEMAMPMWYTEMSALPGCSDFNKRGMLKFVMGHTHCNSPHPHGKVGEGFRVAGFGMEGCGNYGVPIVDSTGGRIRFWYFDTSSTALLEKVVDCVSKGGWRACTSLATKWLDQPIVKPDAAQVVV